MRPPLRRAADNDDRPTQPRGRGGRPEVSTIMIRISIPIAAYEAICATLPVGNVAVEPEANAKGEAHRLAGGRDGGSSIPSLGDGVMLGTAWIDRPVDTQGLRSLLPRPPQRSMEARPCSSQ